MTTERDIRNQIKYAEKHGREEGREVGREEGREQQALETARRMLKMGLERTIIAQATNLTEEQIKAL